MNAKLKEMYDKCRCTEDILVDVIRLLYPEDTFKTGTIRGYIQGDWQDYIVMGDVDTDLLEAMYFGKISDITVTTDEEEFVDVITHDELWRAEREEGLKEFFRNFQNLFSYRFEPYFLFEAGAKVSHFSESPKDFGTFFKIFQNLFLSLSSGVSLSKRVQR